MVIALIHVGTRTCLDTTKIYPNFSKRTGELSLSRHFKHRVSPLNCPEKNLAAYERSCHRMYKHDDPARALIDILAQPGAAATLLGLHARAGNATLAQLGRPAVTDALKIVPVLAAAGLVTACGTFDELDATSQLSLTPDGEEAAVAILGLKAWARRHRTRSPRRPAWIKRLRAVWLYSRTLLLRIDRTK
jgi:hypothetical protein